MHIVDAALIAEPVDGPDGLAAWRSLDIPYADPDWIRLLRTWLRHSVEEVRAVVENLPHFLSEIGQEDTYEVARSAWTEDLSSWQTGIETSLSHPKQLFYLSWVVEAADGSQIPERLEAVTLTEDKALVTVWSGPKYGSIPMLAGIITRDRATRSLCLLLSKMQTCIVDLALLHSDFDTDLEWPEPVRIALASEGMHLPDVLNMTKDQLLDLGRQLSWNDS